MGAPLSLRLAGLFSAVGGLGLTMTTGIGSPLAGVYYTLSGIAAVVIGGVSLSGGRGGIVGPVLAAYVLTFDSDRPNLPQHRPEFWPGDPGHADRASGDDRRPDCSHKDAQMSAGADAAAKSALSVLGTARLVALLRAHR